MKKTALLSVLTLAACSSGSGGALLVPRPDGGAAGTGAAGMGAAGAGAANTKTYMFQSVVNRDVDMLFMIDNSLGMKAIQDKFAAALPTLVSALAAQPGGLPNLHVGFISSDLGAGPFSATEIPACRTGGDAGAFRSNPNAVCAGGAGLNPGQSFITVANGGGQTNYAGELGSLMSCLSHLGDTGCGFEHQLASVLRALGADGAPPPPTNANFLRPNAYLVVVLLTNEDDCSAPPNSMVFNPASRFVSDPLGPLSSYRCNEFGHLCGGVRPPRASIPAGGTDLTGTCKSAEDGTLLKLSDVAARLKALKSDPAKVIVAAIAGPPNPYVVETGFATLKDDPVQNWPQIRHSCAQGTAEYADPGVRIAELVGSFGANGLFQVACNETFMPAVDLIGKKVGQAISSLECLDAGTDVNTCTAVDRAYEGQGMRVDSPLPRCSDNGGAAPCWSAADSVLCGTGLQIQLKRTLLPPADTVTVVTCQRP